MAEINADGVQAGRGLLSEPRRPDRIRRSPRAAWFAVGAVCVGAFLGQLDASIVTIALPDIRTRLGVSLPAAEWVALAYLVTVVASVSVVGRVSDVLGRKLVYLYGFGLFTAASLGCGLAGNLTLLVVLRVVQGLGAAMLQANSVALIRTTVPDARLGKAIGFQAAAQAAGLAAGPVAGGLLVAAGGWRWVFLANVPVGLIGIGLGVVLLPRTRIRAVRVAPDPLGVVSLVAGIALLVYAADLVGHVPAARSVLVVACALAILVGFWRHERRHADPLIDPAIVAGAGFVARLAAGLLCQVALFGVLLVTPLYLEGAWHLSAGWAGAALVSVPAGICGAAPIAWRLAARFGPGPTSAVSVALAAGALAGVATLPGRVWVVVLLGVAGIGIGVFTPANNAAVAGAGAPEQAGLVSGLMNMCRGLGTAFGVAVGGAVFAAVAGAHPQAMGVSDGYRTVTVVLAGVCALAAVACLPVPGRLRRARGVARTGS